MCCTVSASSSCTRRQQVLTSEHQNHHNSSANIVDPQHIENITLGRKEKKLWDEKWNLTSLIHDDMKSQVQCADAPLMERTGTRPFNIRTWTERTGHLKYEENEEEDGGRSEKPATPHSLCVMYSGLNATSSCSSRMCQQGRCSPVTTYAALMNLLSISLPERQAWWWFTTMKGRDVVTIISTGGSCLWETKSPSWRPELQKHIKLGLSSNNELIRTCVDNRLINEEHIVVVCLVDEEDETSTSHLSIKTESTEASCTPGFRNRLRFLCRRAWFSWFPVQNFWRNRWVNLMISCIFTSLCRETQNHFVSFFDGTHIRSLETT